MKQTPLLHQIANPSILALMPDNAKRIVEIGCGNGNIAREYKRSHQRCEYIGLEIEPRYADIARSHCDRVIVGDIEHLADDLFASLFPSDCWVFGDVLEHLYDPWSVLRKIHTYLRPNASVIACIPNAQHWSVQVRLNSGELWYEDSGLLDRTHIRWFTKKTIIELFRSTGFTILEGAARIFEEPEREKALVGVRALAEAMGADAEAAVENATAFQWVVRAVPTTN